MNPTSNRNSPRLLILKSALFGGLFLAVTALAPAEPVGTATPDYGQDFRRIEAQVETLLNQLTLDEKLKYLVGNPPADPALPDSTSQDIPAVPRLGLPELRNFDGPMGVRLNHAGQRGGQTVPVPSTRFPANLLLAATWNPERAFDQAKGIARDGRARGFAVWYGPGMNMYRVPVGGRNAEYLCGEDPLLGSRLAVAQVFGAQTEGIVATAKHLLANDQEYRRFLISNAIGERTLREIYFPPFEAAVRQGHAGSVMLAYNKLNGIYCAENPFLMRAVLEADWGFRGFTVSDYGAVHDPVAAIQAGLDIIFGRSAPSTAPLLQAVQSGQLPLAVVDDAVRRILRVIVAFNFQNRPAFDPSIPLDDPFSSQAGLNTAREGITLLKNEGGLLPFRRGQTRSIAVVGRYAGGDPPQEAGSAGVVPIHFTSELAGLQQVANGATRVDYLRAGNLDFGVAEFRVLGANGQYQPGLKAEYFNNQDLSGSPVLTRQEAHLSATYPANAPPEAGSSFSVRWSGELVAPVTGDYAVKFQVSSNARLYIASQKIYDDWTQTADPTDVESRRRYPIIVVPKVHLQAGQPLAVQLEYKYPGTLVYVVSSFTAAPPQVGLGWAPLEAPADLGTYDAVVITAGYDISYEGENADRAAVTQTRAGSFELPELQDELIQKMEAANPHTVVVLHGCGSMDVQPWIAQVPGLVHAMFPGQDGGLALAEILFGDVNPSGKLPFTFEKRFQDNPAYPNYPSVDPTGTTAAYREGIFVGYRGYEKNGVTPQYPFGYGLSYTTFAYSDLDVEPAREGNSRKEDGPSEAELREQDGERDHLARVSFTVSNTGNRAGAEVAELYIGQQNPTVPRPIKELKGFKKVFLQPGESRRITLELDQRSFAYFNTATEQWDALPDTYNILLGASSQDIRLKGKFKLQSELTSNP
jgi:beta-glucosidase